jgi:hypothetical protein
MSWQEWQLQMIQEAILTQSTQRNVSPTLGLSSFPAIPQFQVGEPSSNAGCKLRMNGSGKQAWIPVHPIPL